MDAMKILSNGRQLSLKNDAVLGENGHVEGKRKLLLPERSETNLEVVRYLSSRGIDREIIRDCIDFRDKIQQYVDELL